MWLVVTSGRNRMLVLRDPGHTAPARNPSCPGLWVSPIANTALAGRQAAIEGVGINGQRPGFAATQIATTLASHR